MLLLPHHTEEFKGQLWHIKCEMLIHGVHKDLRASWLACGVLGVFESIQGAVDDSSSLLLWGRVRPAMTGQRGWVEEEVDGWHVHFNELLF